LINFKNKYTGREKITGKDKITDREKVIECKKPLDNTFFLPVLLPVLLNNSFSTCAFYVFCKP